MEQLSDSIVHHAIIKHIIDNLSGPSIDELAALLRASQNEVTQALMALRDNHGVVLHPDSSRIWVIHPFSLAPTNFLVRSGNRKWWGNCAWCSLGIASLLQRDVVITTTLGADDRQVHVNIRDGKIIDGEYFVHFPIPMRHAWNNVIYTCSMMLLFKSEQQIDIWCREHNMPKGDVQPIIHIWEFAKIWYGNHLSPNWKKWTTEEAQIIFDRFGLTGDTWQIPQTGQRF